MAELPEKTPNGAVAVRGPRSSSSRQTFQELSHHKKFAIRGQLKSFQQQPVGYRVKKGLATRLGPTLVGVGLPRPRQVGQEERFV